MRDQNKPKIKLFDFRHADFLVDGEKLNQAVEQDATYMAPELIQKLND